MSMFSVLASQLTIDTTPPTTVQNLVATPTQTSSDIQLDWSSSSDNVGVAGYQIWRADEFGAFALIGITSVNGYIDNTTSYSTSYQYKIRAYDAANNFSEYSNIASIRP
jgi:chitodextrinase